MRGDTTYDHSGEATALNAGVIFLGELLGTELSLLFGKDVWTNLLCDGEDVRYWRQIRVLGMRVLWHSTDFICA